MPLGLACGRAGCPQAAPAASRAANPLVDRGWLAGVAHARWVAAVRQSAPRSADRSTRCAGCPRLPLSCQAWLPPSAPQGARGGHRLRSASPVPKPGAQPGQAERESSGRAGLYGQGQALRCAPGGFASLDRARAAAGRSAAAWPENGLGQEPQRVPVALPVVAAEHREPTHISATVRRQP